MSSDSGNGRRRILSPWDAGAPPLAAVPRVRDRLGRILGPVPTRREVMAEQVAARTVKDMTLDELARQLGTDAGDVDLWAAFGLDDGGGRRLVFRPLDGMGGGAAAMSAGWAHTLTPAQREACRLIMDAHAGDRQAGARHGFRAHMTPTIGPPRRLELRLYGTSGRLLRTWVISDG